MPNTPQNPLEGTAFTVTGTSKCQVCDCCGKSDLARTIAAQNEVGKVYALSCVCAARLLRHRGQGQPANVAQIIALSIAAQSSKDWQTCHGYTPASFQMVRA